MSVSVHICVCVCACAEGVRAVGFFREREVESAGVGGDVSRLRGCEWWCRGALLVLAPALLPRTARETEHQSLEKTWHSGYALY